MTEKRFILKGLVDGVPNVADKGKIIEQEDVVQLLNNQDERIQELLSCNHGIAQKQIRMLDKLIQLEKENEELKKEKEFWKGDACKCSSYLSILSMDCQIVQEAISDLKNVIDVDTEAFKLLDKLDGKFDELNQHRLRIYYTGTDKRYCKDCKNLGLDGMFGLICDVNGNNKNYDCPKYEEK